MNKVVLTAAMAAWIAWIPAQAEKPKEVIITNLPATQDVSGTVSVDNFPAEQAVSGVVSVDNFPANQPVSGTVDVGNFPAVQAVNGEVSVSNFPPSISPTLRSGRLRLNLTTLGQFDALTVPVGQALTDLVYTPFENGDFFCSLTIWQGPVSIENILFQPVVPDRTTFQMNLTSGLEGPITIRVTAGGSGTGSCNGSIFWTGHDL